ncbi:hypothetical protein BDZ94DRAFT_1269861 [Collybia nuda]|uniref:Uncharacterized protein n=1 Tax=Collybia nuda TaxID=64659 RepID=A0A9P5XXX8_9AGAR|nr:hypothetical protein BDZ94DRAFT_1269861 [Collybia nuda]
MSSKLQTTTSTTPFLSPLLIFHEIHLQNHLQNRPQNHPQNHFQNYLQNYPPWNHLQNPRPYPAQNPHAIEIEQDRARGRASRF